MTVLAIIQARMGSTRLPGKSMKKILDRPVVSYVVERIRHAKKIDDLIVATTVLSGDDAIADFCREGGIRCFRGDSDDVLSRYFYAASAYLKERGLKAEELVIVRITADCPLLDPRIIDQVVLEYQRTASSLSLPSYVSNTIATHPQSWPKGMDVEVFAWKTLEEMAHLAKTAYEKEHVTPYIYQHPEKYRLKMVEREGENLSHLRLTLDTSDDFKIISAIIEALYPERPDFSLQDILALLKKNPALFKQVTLPCSN